MSHTDRAGVRGPAHGLARGIAIAYFVAILLAVLLEVAVRASDARSEGIPFAASPDFNHDLIVRDSLGVHGRPEGRFEKWRLNSAGLRSPESVLARRPGCIRVLTLGSSETFGSFGEGPGKEYPAQLRDSLAGHGCYQVLNGAIVGMSVLGMIEVWNRWASRFDPDIVVVIANPTTYLGDRPPRVSRPGRGQQARDAPRFASRLAEKMHQWIHYPDLIQQWRIERKLAELTSGRPTGWEFRAVPADRLNQYREDLDSLLRTVNAHHARVLLVAHPIRARSMADASDRAMLHALRTFAERARPEVILAFDSAAAQGVRELGQRTSTPVVDLPPVMNGRHELFDDAVHYTNAGAAVVAGEVARALIRMR